MKNVCFIAIKIKVQIKEKYKINKMKLKKIIRKYKYGKRGMKK